MSVLNPIPCLLPDIKHVDPRVPSPRDCQFFARLSYNPSEPQDDSEAEQARADKEANSDDHCLRVPIRNTLHLLLFRL